MLPRVNFTTPYEADMFAAKIGGPGSQKRITAKTLCEITGTKYYVHNEEIGYGPDRIVRVYDENDVLIGSIHDLENKKKKAVEFLKDHTGLKFYMKVNIYDPENVQKGKLMLMNIAEDLKEYAKVKVSPMDQETKAPPEEVKSAKSASLKKSKKIEDIQKEADR